MFKTLSGSMKEYKGSNLEMKTIMSEMKNILYGINKIADIRISRKNIAFEDNNVNYLKCNTEVK